MHAERYPGVARALRRADRRPARGHRRAWSDDREAAREPVVAEGAERQRDGDGVPHAHSRPRGDHPSG